MAAIRFTGRRNMGDEEVSPGDTVMGPEFVSTLTTVGAATIPASAMVTGVLLRSGSTSGFTDTFDTASNVLAAVAGNGPQPAIVPGLSFKLRVINSTTVVETIALGAGMVAGSGTIATVGTAGFRDFLFSFASVQPPFTLVCNGTSGSAAVTWSLNSGQVALPEGTSSVSAVNLQPGAAAIGTGVAAGTTVLGITQGVGGTTGVTLSGTLTATITNSAITFGPAITVNGIGSGSV